MLTNTRNLFRIAASSVVFALVGFNPCMAQDMAQDVKLTMEPFATSLSGIMPVPSTPTIAPTSGELHLAQSTGSQRLYTSMSGDEIEALLKSMNFIYTRSTDRSGDPTFRIAIDRYRVTLFTDSCSNSRCTIIQFYAGFDLSRAFDMSKINEWNRTKRFSRAYLDEEGDPILEAEIALEGGVSGKNLETFIRIYSGSVTRFAEFIGL